jgi:hypothetical protein
VVIDDVRLENVVGGAVPPVLEGAVMLKFPPLGQLISILAALPAPIVLLNVVLVPLRPKLPGCMLVKVQEAAGTVPLKVAGALVALAAEAKPKTLTKNRVEANKGR